MSATGKVLVALTDRQAEVLFRIRDRLDLPVSRQIRTTLRQLVYRKLIEGDPHHRLPGSHRLTPAGAFAVSIVEALGLAPAGCRAIEPTRSESP